ncbi:MAG: pseudouridine synthase [Candidatus Azambacteria bacterium]|nr:pseudouridine synthase [Candidatus Azambacteria bacterium]
MKSTGIRINKYIRDQGLASRREADELIAAGKILVNGIIAKEGMLINEGDEVTFTEEHAPDYQYYAYYKPQGLATQAPVGRRSVITDWKKRDMFPIGRLDKESEGLLIMTNDRRFTRKILGPDSGVEKEYVVHVRESIRQGIPAIIKKGMDTKTFGKLLPADAHIAGKNVIHIALKEGKRHQIRVMLSELDYTVTSLKRIRIGHVGLGGLRSGEARALTKGEVREFFQV